MRRFTFSFLLSLLLIMGAGLEMSAQTIMPQVSTSDDTYTYYIKYVDGSYQSYLSRVDGQDNIPLSVNVSAAQKFKLVASENGDAVYICTSDESYVLYYDEYDTYPTYNSTPGGLSGWFSGIVGTWDISLGSGHSPVFGYTPYFVLNYCGIEDYDYYLVYDGGSYCKLSGWGTNSTWNFIPADLKTLKKTAEDISAAIVRTNTHAGFAFTDEYITEKVPELENQISAVKDLSTYSLASADELLYVYSEYLNFTKYEEDDSFKTGYYRIKNKAEDRNRYLFNDEFTVNNDGYTMLSKEPVETNNGYWHVVVDGDLLTIKNGQGKVIKSVTGGEDPTLYFTTDGVLDSYYSLVNYSSEGEFKGAICASNLAYDKFGSYYCARKNYNFNDITADHYRWAFEPVDQTSAKVYTVSVTGLEDNSTAYVKYTHDGTTEYAYSGGFFISTSELDGSNISAPEQTGYASVSISVEGETIVVKYIKDIHTLLAEIEETLAKAQNMMAIRGVGYPTTESGQYAILSTAITHAARITEYDDVATAQSELDNLKSKISNYATTADGIQMPEDGKAYTFTAVAYDGSRSYMCFDGYEYKLESAEGYTDNEYPVEATLICRDLGDNRYAFVNNAGKFFIWRSGNGYSDEGDNSNRGYSDTYEYGDVENPCLARVKLAKLNLDENNVTPQDESDLLGLMTIQTETVYGEKFYFVIQDGTSYYGGELPYFNETYSSAILIEETNYPNSVKLNAIEDDDDPTLRGYKIGTFSAPFATEFDPSTGVKIFYVSAVENEEGGATAVLTEYENEYVSNYVPANTGVILAGTSEETVTMLPYLSGYGEEFLPTMIEGNLLGNTAGWSREIESDNTSVYVLTRYNNHVAFFLSAAGWLGMNKAYLDKTLAGEELNAAQLTLDFGSLVDGIENVETAEAESAEGKAVFDLSGRRVTNATSGLYIVNGKKVYVK